jgi:hypothetical protein
VPGGNLPGWPPAQPDFEYLGSNFKWNGLGAASIGDIDGDGRQEVVLGLAHCRLWPADISRPCTGLWAFRADGSVVPGFPKATHSPAPPVYSQPAIGDLDGDGRKEIVWVGATGEIIVWNVPGTPGPENFQWPMARQNAAHTGALPP